MVTLTEAIKHLIAKQSDAIHRIKTSSLNVESSVEYIWSSPDGSVIIRGLSSKPEERAGWITTEVTHTKTVEHIAPKHPQWARYRAAREYASQVLTARLLLKIGKDDIPEMPDVTAALKAGSLSHHARRGKARRLVVRAVRQLRKLKNRLDQSPERFADVRAWIDQRDNRATTVRSEGGV